MSLLITGYYVWKQILKKEKLFKFLKFFTFINPNNKIEIYIFGRTKEIRKIYLFWIVDCSLHTDQEMATICHLRQAAGLDWRSWRQTCRWIGDRCARGNSSSAEHRSGKIAEDCVAIFSDKWRTHTSECLLLPFFHNDILIVSPFAHLRDTTAEHSTSHFTCLYLFLLAAVLLSGTWH